MLNSSGFRALNSLKTCSLWGIFSLPSLEWKSKEAKCKYEMDTKITIDEDELGIHSNSLGFSNNKKQIESNSKAYQMRDREIFRNNVVTINKGTKDLRYYGGGSLSKFFYK